jgi:PAS domain S-box-containing protein
VGPQVPPAPPLRCARNALRYGAGPSYGLPGQSATGVNCGRRSRAAKKVRISIGIHSVYTTDAAGRITFFNETAAAMWGRRPELNSEKWCGSWRMYWPDGTPLPHDECPMALAIKERHLNGSGQEAVVERPDGTRVPFMAFPSILRDATGEVVGAVNMFVDITDRKRSEEQISILAREAEHRAKNMLATVQATVHLSQADTAEGLKRAIEGRIQALANVHRLFVQSRWAGAELHSLVSQELALYGRDGEARVRIDGPNLSLEPDTAQTIAVTLHELATNAAKYGALSVPTGKVLVTWSCAIDRFEKGGGPTSIIHLRRQLDDVLLTGSSIRVR